MKTFTLLFLFLLSLSAYCQPKETPAQKIRRLEETERMLVINGETEKLFKLWTDDYVVNNPGNMVMTAEQIKSSIRGGGMRGVSYSKNIEKITFVNDIAIVMGSEIVEPKDKLDNGGKKHYAALYQYLDQKRYYLAVGRKTSFKHQLVHSSQLLVRKFCIRSS